jgi:hypothetical protein
MATASRAACRPEYNWDSAREAAVTRQKKSKHRTSVPSQDRPFPGSSGPPSLNPFHKRKTFTFDAAQLTGPTPAELRDQLHRLVEYRDRIHSRFPSLADSWIRNPAEQETAESVDDAEQLIQRIELKLIQLDISESPSPHNAVSKDSPTVEGGLNEAEDPTTCAPAPSENRGLADETQTVGSFKSTPPASRALSQPAAVLAPAQSAWKNKKGRDSLAEDVAKKFKNPDGYRTMSVQEVAFVFEKSPATIYRWLDTGKLPRSRVAGRISTHFVKRLFEKPTE